MELKPGYKQTEVGVVPIDWVVKPLGELGRFKNGINKSSDAFGHGSPFINLMDVFGVNSIKSDESFGLIETNEAEQRTYDVKQGDVLFIRSSVKPSGVGLTAVVEVDLPKTVFSGFLLRFRDSGTLTLDFKRHCFYAQAFRSKLIGASSVSANTNINQDNLRKLMIAFPPTHQEQREIAKALSDVDELVAAQERLIAKKRDIKQAVMQQLLTGQTRLAGFCDEWVEAPLGELFDFYGGLSASRDELSQEAGYCYLHYGDIHGRSQSWIDLDNEQTKIPKLDVPLNRVTPTSLLRDSDVVFVDASEDEDGTNKHVLISNPSNTPFISGLHTIVARPRLKRFAKEFLAYCFDSDHIRSQFRLLAVGTKVKGVNKTSIKKVVLRYPPIEEQVKIGMILRDIDAELVSLQGRLEKTRDIKQGMMQQLLTGKVRLV